MDRDLVRGLSSFFRAKNGLLGKWRPLFVDAKSIKGQPSSRNNSVLFDARCLHAESGVAQSRTGKYHLFIGSKNNALTDGGYLQKRLITTLSLTFKRITVGGPAQLPARIRRCFTGSNFKLIEQVCSEQELQTEGCVEFTKLDGRIITWLPIYNDITIIWSVLFLFWRKTQIIYWQHWGT